MRQHIQDLYGHNNLIECVWSGKASGIFQAVCKSFKLKSLKEFFSELSESMSVAGLCDK